MNFAKTELETLVQQPKSQNTIRKTALDVQFFQQFLLEIGVDNAMEDIPEEELVIHLCCFFGGVKKRSDGSDFEPTTLWGFYASLKRHLTELNYQFADSKHITVALAPVTEVLKAVSRTLKKNGKGNQPNASDAVSSEEIQELFTSKVAGRHNPQALNNAMLIMLMFLGFRGCSELYSRMLGDLEIVTVDGKKEVRVSRGGLARTRTGEVPIGLPSLVATGGSDCPVLAFEELLRRRPAKYTGENTPLFLRPNNSFAANHNVWFYNSRVGINQISKMLRIMMINSDIDTSGRKITNSSCRKILGPTLLKKSYFSKATMKKLPHSDAATVLRHDANDTPVGKFAWYILGQPDSERPCSSKEAHSGDMGKHVDDLQSSNLYNRRVKQEFETSF